MLRVISTFAITCAFLSTPGCGSGPTEPLASATGLVTLDNRPIEGVSITLIPKEGSSFGRISYAVTDGEGRFELQTSPTQKGAIIGTHWVQLIKMVQEDGSPIPPDAPPEEIVPINLLPQAYAEVSTTPIEAIIPDDGATDLRFELSSKAQPRPQY